MITSWLNYLKSYEHLFSIDNLQEQDEQIKKKSLTWLKMKPSFFQVSGSHITSLTKIWALFIYLVTFTHSKNVFAYLVVYRIGCDVIDRGTSGCEIWPSIYIRVLESFWPSSQLLLTMFTERRQKFSDIIFLILFCFHFIYLSIHF